MSSIRGAAVTAVKIDGVLHEFSTIKGIREDVIEILMNLKHIPVRARTDKAEVNEDGFKIITLDSDELGKDFFTRDENPGVITAKDINKVAWDHDFEFCGDGVLCSLEPDAHLLMEIYVEQGVGYLSAERERPSQPPLPIDAMLADAIFSPVKRVNYQIENARVGQSIDFERLILEVWTNGAVSPEEAVKEAARIAQNYFGQIADTVNTAPQKSRQAENETPDIMDIVDVSGGEDEQLGQSIHALELSIRSENCLLRGGIQTIGDLLRKSRDDLLKIRNLGRKSLNEIEEKLKTFGYVLMPSSPAPEEAPASEEAVSEAAAEEEAPESEEAAQESEQEVPAQEENPEQSSEEAKPSEPEAEPEKEPEAKPAKPKRGRKAKTEAKTEEEPKAEETKAESESEPEPKPKTRAKAKTKTKAKTKAESEPETADE